MRKPQCPRCGRNFVRETELLGHAQGDIACERRLYSINEGITVEQHTELRKRIRTTRETEEKMKWERVYSILFPDDDPDDMPSACKLYELISMLTVANLGQTTTSKKSSSGLALRIRKITTTSSVTIFQHRFDIN